MPRLCSADKIIIGNFHGLPQLFYAAYNFIYILLRSYPLFFGDGLNLLPVLVRTGEEPDIITGQSLESRHGVCHYRTIGMPYMKVGTRIVNRSCNIVFSFALCHFYHSFPARLRMGSSVANH